MSRSMSSAQIIAQGDYLKANFEASTLTISQILGILGFHGVSYPSVYTKPKLVAIFNTEIAAKATKFKKERLKREDSLASSDGIKDGITGRALTVKEEPVTDAAPPRRSSRRLSRAPSEDVQEISSMRPDPPKRRRSSAQPNLGGPSRKAPNAQPIPVLAEESEPEEEDLPVRKVGRTKKTSAGAQARRVSGPDSGWEDNNIFQAGVESSSPVRASPIRKAPRKSTLARKTRKSTSAPPQLPPSSPPTPHSPIFTRLQEEEEEKKPTQALFTDDVEEDVFVHHRSPSPLLQETPVKSRAPSASRFVSPPQAERFAPRLPPHMIARRRDSEAEVRGMILSPAPSRFQPAEHENEEDNEEDQPEDQPVGDPEVRSPEQPEEESEGEEEEEQEEADEEDEDNHTVAVSKRLAHGGKPLEPAKSGWSLWKMALAFAILPVLYFGYEEKLKQQSIGYCDAGKSVNSHLLEINHTRELQASCWERRENITAPLKWIDATGWERECPLFWGDRLIASCTPCPEHATCTPHAVQCNKDLILKPASWLSSLLVTPSPNTPFVAPSWPSLSQPGRVAWRVMSMLDGVPGLGSVAFPPVCGEDPLLQQKISGLGKSLDYYLRLTMGERLCAGNTTEVPEAEGGEAKRWGHTEDEMKQVSRKHLKDTDHFDSRFNAAVVELLNRHTVVMREDLNGTRYYADKDPKMTKMCHIKVAFWRKWQKFQWWAYGALTFVGTIEFLKRKQANKAVLNKRVAELVQVALDTLRNQEMAHYTDPVSAPQVYLSPLQLRDLILQDEHSVSARKKLWGPVERVIEENANVRVNMEEVDGGDEMRVWRWVGGGSGFRSPVKYGAGGTDPQSEEVYYAEDENAA